jgi:hypothetical protein
MRLKIEKRESQKCTFNRKKALFTPVKYPPHTLSLANGVAVWVLIGGLARFAAQPPDGDPATDEHIPKVKA